MTDAKKLVVLAGATGDLGALIARALLDEPGVELRLLTRPQSLRKLADLRARGAEAAEVDLERPEDAPRLEAALRGADCVISAVQGGPELIVDGQLRLLAAARRVGARRFIPSNFSYDIFGLEEGDNINSDDRRAFSRAAQAARSDVEVVEIQIGAFLDRKVLFGFLGAFDLARGRAFLWGDGAAPMNFTTYADAARFTAAAALDDAPLPPVLDFAGETLTFPQLVQAYEEGSGKAIAVERLGALEDLDAEIARRRAAAPEDVFAWLPLMYWRAMLSGKARLKAPAADRYPRIRPMGVAEYVREAGL